MGCPDRGLDGHRCSAASRSPPGRFCIQAVTRLTVQGARTLSEGLAARGVLPHSGRSSPRSSGEALDHGSAPSPRKAQLLYPGGNPSRNREKGSEIKIYFFSHFPGSREPRLGTEQDALSLRHDRRHDGSLRATGRVCRRTQLRRIRSCRNDISFLRLLMCGTTHRATRQRALPGDASRR